MSIPTVRFQASGGLLETYLERQIFICITQLPQQAPNFVRLFTRGSDNRQSRLLFSDSKFYAFEQQTLKGLAVFGTVGVNTAAATVKRRARLSETMIAKATNNRRALARSGEGN